MEKSLNNFNTKHSQVPSRGLFTALGKCAGMAILILESKANQVSDVLNEEWDINWERSQTGMEMGQTHVSAHQKK